MRKMMMTTAIASAFALLASSGAADEPVCLPAQEMESALVDWYGEKPMAGAVETETAITRVWASVETGTWTVVKYLVDGSACTIAQGHGFGDSESADDLLAMMVSQARSDT